MCGNFFCTFCIYKILRIFRKERESIKQRRGGRESGGGFKRHENDNGPKGIFDAKQILYINLYVRRRLLAAAPEHLILH